MGQVIIHRDVYHTSKIGIVETKKKALKMQVNVGTKYLKVNKQGRGAIAMKTELHSESNTRSFLLIYI